MGFWHGVVLGAATMALVVALIATVTWVSSSIRAANRPEFGEPAPAEVEPDDDGNNVLEPEVTAEPWVTAEPQSQIGGKPTSDLADELAALPVSTGSRVESYDRTLFGQTWADVDRNGCDTRNDILRRDLADPVIKPGTAGCKVLAGMLIDPFSGNAMSFVSGSTTSLEVQIDHLVPLSWAWKNGASAWSTELRTEFANDPTNLLAVDGGLNQEKSDSGPSEWLPPNRAFHCGYAQLYGAVLVKYEFSVPATDLDVLMDLLARC